MLAVDRKVGDDILKSLRGGGVAWTADHMRVTRYPYVRLVFPRSTIDHRRIREGGGSSINLSRMKASDPRSTLFTTNNLAARRSVYAFRLIANISPYSGSDLEAQLQAAESEFKATQAEISHLAQFYNDLSRKIDNLSVSP